MIVVIYSKDGGEKRIATAYVGKTLAQVKAEGWESNPNVAGYYQVADENKADLGGGVWKCSLTAAQVEAQGTAL